MPWSNHRPKEHDKWAVDVHRFTTTKGWEFYQDAVGFSGDDKTDGRGGASKEIDSSLESITAAPRRGSIEIKRLRLRVHLFHSPQKQIAANKTNIGTSKDNTSSNVTQDSCTPSHKHDETAQTTVVRRRDTILLSTRKGFGAVLLKFQSVTECIAFSDRLVELNHDFTHSSPSHSVTPTPLQRPKKRIKINENKARMKNGKENSSGTKSTQQAVIQTSNNAKKNTDDAHTARKASTLSYIVRLLHDDDFLDFVDTVETSLSLSPDCLHILDGLTYPRPEKDFLNQFGKD